MTIEERKIFYTCNDAKQTVTWTDGLVMANLIPIKKTKAVKGNLYEK